MFNLEKQFVYRIDKSDTISSICSKFNTTVENIYRNNNEIPLYAGEVVEIKINNYISHFVTPTQTLKDISKIYNLEIDVIKKQNNLKDDKLFIGQILKIYKT